MTSFLRRYSIRARLGVLGALSVAVLLTLTALALDTTARGKDNTARMQRLGDVAEHALRVKADLADLNGWQNAYALDVHALGPAAAADGATNRSAFLRTHARTVASLGVLAADLARGDLPAQWTTALQAAKGHLDEFMTLDTRIAGLYASGTPTGTAQADKLVDGEEVAVFEQAAHASDQLVAAAADLRREQARRSNADARTARTLLWWLAAAGLLVVGAGAALISASISRPVQALRSRLTEIATGDGDLRARLEVTGRDELAGASAQFNTFADRMAATIREVTDNAVALASAGEQLSATTATIAGAAEDTSTRADAVAGSARAVTRNVQDLAAATAELGESIREIAEHTSRATDVAETAVQRAERTSATIRRLGEASAEITEVVSLISGIAAQTNLLALNATIEAARAGEAGRGFAVVANEVKELAQGTARATADIGQRVGAIQDQTSEAVAAIGEIAAVIGEIAEFQGSITAAVEEQTATTATMSGAVSDAATSIEAISATIDGVAGAAATTRSSLGEAVAATGELSRMGGELQQAVSGYRT